MCYASHDKQRVCGCVCMGLRKYVRVCTHVKSKGLHIYLVTRPVVTLIDYKSQFNANEKPLQNE